MWEVYQVELSKNGQSRIEWFAAPYGSLESGAETEKDLLDQFNYWIRKGLCKREGWQIVDTFWFKMK